MVTKNNLAVAEIPKRLRVDPSAHPAASLILKLEGWDEVTEDERAVIKGMLLSTVLVESRQDIVAEGSRPSTSTLLVDGFVARYKLVENGGRQITAVHTPGDFIDLHSFLLHKMDHGLSALTQCRLAGVPHTALDSISQNHPHLSRLLWVMTLVDGAIHREWLVAMGRRSAMEHLAHLICEIYTKLVVINLAPDYQFLFPATQADIADMMGLSAVHVNRSLQELRARGLVQWQGHTVTILDFPALKEFGQFDPTYLHQVREPR